MMRRLLTMLFGMTLVGLLVFAVTQTTSSQAPAPGVAKETWTKILGIGAAVLQNTTPVNQLDMYLDGFHFQHERMDIQEEAHHYCYQMTEEFAQCTIFDGNEKEAKLIGIEHIISRRLFETLPEDERRMWHPHHYEVKAGLLMAPGIPQTIENRLMEKLVGTYGKTWHVWHTQHDQLPVGRASLMMGFTADGQIRQELVEDRDRRFDISTAHLRQQRATIPDPHPLPSAAPAPRR
jgi:hypothetical protein